MGKTADLFIVLLGSSVSFFIIDLGVGAGPISPPSETLLSCSSPSFPLLDPTAETLSPHCSLDGCGALGEEIGR